ncbi:hypothetical protein [Pseudomonas lutea]|uniref:Prophage PSSB64-02 n=1 Tax=Pseudomonas lutea TaxID=243924 RepID=A0A9X0JIE9_9PSED|nr:hypothetical protein [Pseudomonas lutea]KGF63614.1 prophage PSSB64-02 [Pseudomonas lutea]
MAYGLQFVNNSGVVTLDSEFARLVVIESGDYIPNSDGGLTSIVSFAQAITTPEPPLIFARPTTEAGTAAISSVQIYGTPGAWTGFSVRTRSVDYLQPRGKWFAAAFEARAVAAYGMRLWDGAGKLLFDTGTPCAVFTAAFQTWTYRFTQQLAIGNSNFFSVSNPFPESDYMLINNFGMSLVAGNNPGRLLTSLWDFPNKTLYAVTTSTANPNSMNLPALFARMVV